MTMADNEETNVTTKQIDAVYDRDPKADPRKPDLTPLSLTVEIPWPRNFQSDDDLEDVRLAMLSAGLAAAAQIIDRHRRPTGISAAR
jgi:hypothetical protein